MNSRTCSNCGRQTYMVRSVINRGSIIEGCDVCLPEQLQQGHDGVTHYNREWQKREFRRDLLQPGQREFIKEYPKQASEMYDPETIRKNS